MTYAYLGCDPGASGGLTILGVNILAPSAFKMPDTERDLWDLMCSLKTWDGLPVRAAIERVASRPGQGVASMFKFGMGYGALRMAVIAAGIPFRDVTPGVWQKALGCQTGGDKNVTKRMAQQLFPTNTWTHATADSALIAEWLRRQEA